MGWEELVAYMSDDGNEGIAMAQCGACDSIIPLDSTSCADCGLVIGGISEEVIGECGACGSLIPADSTSCDDCGVFFVDLSGKKSDTEEQVEIPSDNDAVSFDNTDDDTVETSDSNLDIDEDILEETEEEPEEEIEVKPEEDTEEQLEETTEEVVEEEVENEPDEETEYVSDKLEETDEKTDEILDIDAEDEESEVENEQDNDSEYDATDSTDGDDEADTVEEEMSDEAVDEADNVSEDSDAVVKIAFENLALAIAEKNLTAAEAFQQIDTSEDNKIDGPELQKGIQDLAGEKLSPKEIIAILDYLDTNNDNRIDSTEFFNKIDELRIGISAGKLPKVKEFPSATQKFLMGKKANDIFYPIMYFIMATFVGLWVVNGMGLLVDGTGGPIEYEGHTFLGEDVEQGFYDLCNEDLDDVPEPCSGEVTLGDVYPCDPKIDSNDCANSLTVFSGENGASSMPAGFYPDAYVMMGVGIAGLIATFYLHKIYAPKLRKIAKGDKPESQESAEEIDQDEDETDTEEKEPIAQEDKEEDYAESDSGDEDDYEDDDYDIDDEGYESESEDDEAYDEDDDEDYDEDYDDDEIDIGSWVGLEIDGEEVFGEILEFDDDKGTVTIETDDGEEITGDQDDMFLEDDE